MGNEFPRPSPGTVASAAASTKAQAKLRNTRVMVSKLGLTQAQMGALIGVPGFRLSAADLPTLLRIAEAARAKRKEQP